MVTLCHFGLLFTLDWCIVYRNKRPTRNRGPSIFTVPSPLKQHLSFSTLMEKHSHTDRIVPVHSQIAWEKTRGLIKVSLGYCVNPITLILNTPIAWSQLCSTPPTRAHCGGRSVPWLVVWNIFGTMQLGPCQGAHVAGPLSAWNRGAYGTAPKHPLDVRLGWSPSLQLGDAPPMLNLPALASV